LVGQVLRKQRAKENSRLWATAVLEADPQYPVFVKNNLRFHPQRRLILRSELSSSGSEYLDMKVQLGTFK